MIYTSYYGFVKRYGIKKNFAYIAISNGIDREFPSSKCDYFIKYKTLTPIWENVDELKKNIINWDEFESRYFEQTNINNKDIALEYEEQILKLMQSHDCENVVLLCFETDVNKCHRQYMTKYFSNCKELTYEDYVT